MIGIHTPETKAEEDPENVKKNVLDRQLPFPVLIDGEKKNWNEWGNSMWPSVYIIDKKGYIRYWWYGELNWKGAGGQRIMELKIKELLKEAG